MGLTKVGNFGLGGGQRSYSFPYAGAGRIVGSTEPIPMPVINCEQVFFRAHPDNAGNVYIGGSDVTTDIGMPLEPGDFSPWIPVQNLSLIYYVCANATDNLQYFIVR